MHVADFSGLFLHFSAKIGVAAVHHVFGRVDVHLVEVVFPVNEKIVPYGAKSCDKDGHEEYGRLFMEEEKVFEHSL